MRDPDRTGLEKSERKSDWLERSEKPGSLGKQATRRQLPVLSLLSFFKEDTIGDWNVFQVSFLSFVLGTLVQERRGSSPRTLESYSIPGLSK